MSDIMEFANREEFRKWLYEHCMSNIFPCVGRRASGQRKIRNFDAKTDAGWEKRIAWMVDRLNKNLKPM